MFLHGLASFFVNLSCKPQPLPLLVGHPFSVVQSLHGAHHQTMACHLKCCTIIGAPGPLSFCLLLLMPACSPPPFPSPSHAYNFGFAVFRHDRSLCRISNLSLQLLSLRTALSLLTLSLATNPCIAPIFAPRCLGKRQLAAAASSCTHPAALEVCNIVFRWLELAINNPPAA